MTRSSGSSSGVQISTRSRSRPRPKRHAGFVTGGSWEYAQRILVWPVDEAVIAGVGFVAAGMLNGIIVRFVVVKTNL